MSEDPSARIAERERAPSLGVRVRDALIVFSPVLLCAGFIAVWQLFDLPTLGLTQGTPMWVQTLTGIGVGLVSYALILMVRALWMRLWRTGATRQDGDQQ